MIPVVQTKSASDDVASAFEDFARAFEAFKDTNDTRLSEIETRLSGDVVTDEKLARIDTALDDAKRRLDRLALDRSRPPLGSATRTPRAIRRNAEHKAAFHAYIRTGEAAGLKRLEEKALSAGSGPDGGYLVPDTVEREVLRRLSGVSPIRAISSVRVISGGQYKRAFSTTGPATGWVGETAARPQTASPTLVRDELPGHGALRHAGGDPDPARRRGGRYRPAGSPRRSRPPSPSRKAPPSSTATASTSRRAFSPADTVEDEIWEWGTARHGARPAARPSRPTTRPTCSST